MNAIFANIPAEIGSPAAWEAVLRLALAAALGALIGVERERHGRSAGLRTQLLVALGAALAMLVSLHFGEVYGEGGAPAVRVDPARIAYGVMGGIGFLGAGAIIRYGIGVRGLTTAASLWCTAAVGLACGFGMYLLAGAAAGIVIFALLVLPKIHRLVPSVRYKSITVTMPAGPQDNILKIRQLLLRRGAHILDLEYRLNTQEQTDTITFHVRTPSGVRLADLADIRQEAPEIQKLSIQ